MSLEDALARGYLETEDIRDRLPTEERLKRGFVAIIECPQEIPCNPCSESCPFDAISMEGINGIPIVDYEKCTGCTICAQVCPGHAIFMTRIAPDGSHAIVVVPHEFLPVPERGETVALLNRKGEKIGEGEVLWLLKSEKEVHYYLVALKVPRELWTEVRALEVMR